MARILLTGITGQVGRELQRTLTPLGEVIALDRQELDLANPASIMAVLEHYQPTIIVNPAAYTAVDRAEAESALALTVNAEAPALMAQWAAQHQALLVHYSTDYVFDGHKDAPYTELDVTHPQSVYGSSKCQGEEAIRAATPKHLILRTSWVYALQGSNFIKTILRLAKERTTLNVVADQHGAPTSALLIAEVSAHILQQYLRAPGEFAYGTYHLCAAGVTTWCDYARLVVQLAQQEGLPLALAAESICPIPTTAYPVPAPRPASSRLDCSKLQQNFGLTLPEWQHGVSTVVKQLSADV